MFYVNKRCRRLAKIGNLDDLIQAANMGLIKAVERYDPQRPTRFSTMAYWWIKQSVNAWADRHGRSISIPNVHNRYLAQISAITSRALETHGKPPAREELAKALGITPRLLDQVIENGRPIDSLDFRVSDDGLPTLIDFVSAVEHGACTDSGISASGSDVERLLEHIGTMPEADQTFLKRAWGIEEPQLSHSEMADLYGLTIRQVRNKLQQMYVALREMLDC